MVAKDKKKKKKAKQAEVKFSWRTFFKIWRTFGRHLLPYWAWLSLAFIGLILTIIVDLAQPWPLKFIIDYIATPDRPLPDHLRWLQVLGESESRMLLTSVLMIIGITLGQAVFGFMNKYLMAVVGVLLIAAILSAEQLKAMLDAAFELNMFVLLEAFDRADIDKAVPILERCGPALDANGHCNYLLGVNCRDLRTLQVDFAHFERLAPALPAEMPWVAESGVSKSEQAALLATLGYRLALVGTALMRSADPAATLQEFRTAGVAACS